MPIKDFLHHYPRALFNDMPSVWAQLNDTPGSQGKRVERSWHIERGRRERGDREVRGGERWEREG